MRIVTSLLLAIICVIGVPWSSVRAAQTTCKQDLFDTYPDGNLDGLNNCVSNVCNGGIHNGEACTVNGNCTTTNGGWAKTGPAGLSSQLIVHNHTAQIVFNNGTGTDMVNTEATWSVGCAQCSVDQTVTVTFAIKRNSATIGANGNEWQISFLEPTGKQLGQWRGSPTNAVPRINSAGTTPSSVNLTPDQFDTLKVVFQMGLRQTDFSWTQFGQSETSIGSILWSTQTAANQPPVGTTTLDKIVVTNLNRENVSNGDLTIDNLIISTSDCSCASSVSPEVDDSLDNFVSEGMPAGAAFPPSLTFQLFNESPSVSINYTAAEVNPDGSAHDYPWLSVAPASGGPIGAGASSEIVASLTPPATPGIYSGNIKITDSCNPTHTQIRPVILAVGEAPCFVEPFQYPVGNLSPNGSWTGGEGTIVIVNDSANQAAKINLIPNSTASAVMTGLGCPTCEDGTITVVARIKGSPTGVDATGAWLLSFTDASNNDLATWEGDYNNARGRTAGTNATPYANLDSTQFHELKAIIDTVHNLTTYYFDGSPLGTPQSNGVELYNGRNNLGNTVNSVALTLQNRTSGGFVLFDDIQILSCSGTCYASVKPKKNNTQLPYALTGGASSVGAPINYTITNEGLESLSYTAQTVDSNGSPFSYSWLSLTNAAGGPLAPGTDNAGALTANVNTTGLPKGAQLGLVKITDACNSTRSYMRSIELNVDDCATETFGFANGDLAAQPGWFTNTPLGVASPIQVFGGAVKITRAAITSTVDAQHITYSNCPVCDDTDLVTALKQGDDLVSIKMKIRGHSGGSALWEMHVTNINLSTDLGSWIGSASSVTPKTSGGEGSPQALTGNGVFDQLEAKINVNTNSVDGIPGGCTQFFFNGVNVGTLSGIPNGARVRNVRFVQISNDFSGDVDPTIEFDDLVISRCVPGCHDPVFDVRNSNNEYASDGAIDDHDLLALMNCMGAGGANGVPTGFEPAAVPNPNLSILECGCMDTNHDLKIDMNDFAVFQRCYTSTGGTADPNCDK